MKDKSNVLGNVRMLRTTYNGSLPDKSAATKLSKVSHLMFPFEGTRCLGSVELVFENRFVTVYYKMHMV